MDLPRPLSHSSITMYQECPLRYKLKYVDNVPEKPKHFFSFGQSMHKALEFFYGVKALPAPSLEELVRYYKENWISTGYRDQAQEAEYFQQGRDILAGYYSRHISAYRVPCFVEYDFKMTVDGVPVTGKVDRIDRLEDGRLAVLDYKTGKALAAQRIREDAQLTMYQLACESLLGAEVGLLTFYHLTTQREHSIERRPQEQVDKLRRRIVETAEGVMAQRFEPRPAESSCRWCDFKVYCPIFGGKPPDAPRSGTDGAQAAAPLPAVDEGLAVLIDRYGELMDRLGVVGREAADVKAAILDILRRKGYVRAFGARYEIQRSGAEKLEFPEGNKKKVLQLLQEAGLYERILAPSGPLIQKLMTDAGTQPELRAALRELGSRIEPGDIKVTPL